MRLLAFLGAHLAPDPDVKPAPERERDARLTLREVARAQREGWVVTGRPQFGLARYAGVLPRIAGGAPTCELIASGKWATNTNWKNGAGEAKKPTAGEDVLIPTGKTVKIEAAAEGRSITVEGTGVVEHKSTLKLGTTTGATSGFIINLASTSSWLGSGQTITLASTAASFQKIALGAKEVPVTNGEINVVSGKYELAEACTVGDEFSFEGGKGVEFKTAGFELLVQNTSGAGMIRPATGAGSTVISLEGATVKTGEWVGDGSATVNQGTSLIVIHDGALGFFEGAKTYYRLWIENTRQQLKTTFSIENELAINKPTKFVLGEVTSEYHEGFAGQTVTLLAGCKMTTNGTEGARGRLKSSSSSVRWKLHLAEDLEVTGGWLDLEGVEVTGGFKLYVPKGEAVGTLSNVNVEFKAKPSGAIKLEGTAKGAGAGAVTVKAAVAGTGSAKGAAGWSATLKGAVSGTGSAKGSGATTATLKGAVAGVCLAAGAGVGSGTLKAKALVAGIAAGVGKCTATLTVGSGGISLSGAAGGRGAGAATVKAAVSIAGAATGRGTATATMLVPVTTLYAGVAPAAYDRAGWVGVVDRSAGGGAVGVAAAEIGGAGGPARVVVGGAGIVGPVITGGSA